MFLPITNVPRDYAWGSRGAISALLGWPASDRIEAELWLGAHSGSPSQLVVPDGDAADETAVDLAGFIAAHPEEALGADHADPPRLPFLLKVLAAASPLSLQAHPTAAQAAEGFARENAAGIPLDAPNRNYKDAYPKPEVIFALEDGFEALCGFRGLDEVRSAIGALRDADAGQTPAFAHWIDLLAGDDPLRNAFTWLISRADGVDSLIARVSGIAGDNAVVKRLAEAYPGDPGIAISLMLNYVVLRAGEALYLPAGNIHAYLTGIGIELMTASDNVLRGGLTPKHVDVPELEKVLDFTPVPVPYLKASDAVEGREEFRPDVPDFRLVRIEGSGSLELGGPAIVLCITETAEVAGASTTMAMASGEAIFVSPDESILHVEGGLVFVATTNDR